MTTELETWEKKSPWVKWREPIRMKTFEGADGWACRICVAKHGLHGADIALLPKNRAAVIDHIKKIHGREIEGL